MRTTTHPDGFDISSSFPNARHLHVWEGGVAYVAERDGFAYVIIDNGTMAEFLGPDDQDLRDGLVLVHRFDSESERDAFAQDRIAHAAGVQFLPWIGNRYGSSPENLRLFILGESHYSREAEHEQFTRVLTAKYVAGWNHRFWTTLARTITARPLSKAECRDFWHSVIFYNFIQTFVGERARVRPTQEMWAAAHRPFLHVLQEHTPDAIVVVGTELWRNLPSAVEGTMLVDGKQWPTKTFQAGARTALATYIRHPASHGYSRAESSAVVKALRFQQRAA